MPRRVFLLAVLLLAFWGTRVVGINAFPPFVDEAFHVNFGTNILNSGPFAHAAEGRQLTIWWYILMQAQAGAQIQVARLATLLAVMLGLAAALSTARLFAGMQGAILAALLFTFSAYHLFFDRLALADPVSASAVLVAICFAARLSRRARLIDAILCGIALFVAIGAKVSALPYLGVPLAAALTLRPSGRLWKEQALWALTATLVGGLLSGAFLLLIYLRGYNPFFYLQDRPTTLGLNSYFEKLTSGWFVVTGYAGTIAAVVFIVALLALLLRRKWFLPLCLLAPLLVLSVSSRQDSRHLVAPYSLLLLSAAVGSRFQRQIQIASLGLVTFWGIVVWLPFAYTAVTSPANTQLTPDDRHEYILAEASGFGLQETLAELGAQHPTRVIGILSNCLSLRYLAGASLPIECPRVSPNGEDRDTLATLLNDSRQSGVYVVLEAIPYAPSSAPGVPVAVIEYPPGRVPLTIYDLSPQP